MKKYISIFPMILLFCTHGVMAQSLWQPTVDALQSVTNNFGNTVPVNMTNAANHFIGTHAGDGSGLTVLSASVVSNGLASINYVNMITNNMATTNYVLTQGTNIALVTATNIVNALGDAIVATMTNAANQFTGTFTGLGSSLTNAAGNGFLDKTATNALATTNYVIAAAQKLIAKTNLVAAVATSGSSETLLLRCPIPANAVAVGDTFRVRVIGVSSSTGTLIFRVRVGANGTTADNQAWISTTSAAQVTNAWAGFDALVTVRSATTVQAAGVAHAGAVMLPQLIGAAATTNIVSSSIWYIDADCTCSSGTFTAQVATIENE